GAPFHAVAFSGDGKTLYAAADAEVVPLNAATGEAGKLFGEATGVAVDNAKRAIKDIHPRALAVSPDGKRLAASDGYGAWMIEPETPGNYGTFGEAAPKDAKPAPAGVAWARGSKVLATISPKRT